MQRASASRVPLSDVTQRVTRKNPALRASGGYVALNEYGDAPHCARSWYRRGSWARRCIRRP